MRSRQRNPLEKVMRVLYAMVDVADSEMGVRDLARTCGLPPSTVHRVVSILEEQGLVRQEQTGERYRLGLEFFRIAWLGVSHFPIRRISLPILRELVDTCNETGVVYSYDPVRMETMPIAIVDTTNPIRHVGNLGTWGPVYAGASGLGIMAFLPEDERRQITSRTGLKGVTEDTITDPLLLEQKMEYIRRQGYAYTRGQRTPGAVGFSAPIWGPDRRVLGDLVLTLPEQRFDPTMETTFARLVVASARRIAVRLGGRVPPEFDLECDGTRLASTQAVE